MHTGTSVKRERKASVQNLQQRPVLVPSLQNFLFVSNTNAQTPSYIQEDTTKGNLKKLNLAHQQASTDRV
jgi:Fe-S cluster biosynthesis and repair protein YggX